MFDERQTADLVKSLNAFQIPMFAFDMRENGEIRAAGHNIALADLVDRAADEVVGLEPQMFMHEEDAAGLKIDLNRCATLRSPLQVSGIGNPRSGPLAYTNTLIPLMDETARIHRIVGNMLACPLNDLHGPYAALVRDITMLSTDVQTTLGRALAVIESQTGNNRDLAPREANFLDTFRTLCISALSASGQLTEIARTKGFEATAVSALMSSGNLSSKVIELIEVSRLALPDDDETA